MGRGRDAGALRGPWGHGPGTKPGAGSNARSALEGQTPNNGKALGSDQQDQHVGFALRAHPSPPGSSPRETCVSVSVLAGAPVLWMETHHKTTS